MRKIPRVRERTATPAELADEGKRCRHAREKTRPLATTTEDEGNLCGALVLLARWRRCCCCNRLVLYVNDQARTDGNVECPTCQGVREALARKLRQTPVLERVALHLWGLFATANDNGAQL